MSLRNHLVATCSQRCIRSLPALATMHFVPACQSRGGDVNCVVRSIARRSLFYGALLAEIFTSAGRVLLVRARSQCVTRLQGYRYLIFANARLVYALSDQCKLHSILGLPQTVRSVQHVGTLRGRRHWRPATSQHLWVSSTCAAERRCRVSTRASRSCRLWPLLSTCPSIPGDFCVACVRSWYYRLGRWHGIHSIPHSANTLDDTDTDVDLENQARDSTLPLLSLMHVTVAG
jgi:hypothetical protein